MPASLPARLLARVCAIAGVLAIVGLAACEPPPAPKPPPAPPVQTQPKFTARHPLTQEEPGFVRLSNTPKGKVPVRVGVLLPFSNGAAATRNLAKAMLNAAQVALFDSRNADIMLLTA